MQFLFCTADPLNLQDHGGSRLCQHELRALNELADMYPGSMVSVLNPPMTQDAFAGDDIACASLPDKHYDLAHFYSQSYSKTITELKKRGTKVSYTVPAHDVAVSKEEHEGLGLNFNYPHLVDPDLWQRYVTGCLIADVLIAQSEYSKGVLREQGCTQPIEVVAPGIVFPSNVKPAPQFAVGFLGSCGPDKGVRYLIEAWDLLNYKDCQLVLAGKQCEALRPLIRQARGSYYLQGYVEDIADFYNFISVYVQPSCTESWGLEITESLSFGRPVITTTNAGGCDAVESGVSGFVCNPKDVGTLANLINIYKTNPDMVQRHGAAAKEAAQKFTWERTRNQLVEIWKGLL